MTHRPLHLLLSLALAMPPAAKPVTTPSQARGLEAGMTQAESAFENAGPVFEPNRGQTNSEVTWLARAGSQTLFLTRTAAVMTISNGDQTPSAVRMMLEGGDWSRSEGIRPTGGISNYFIGNDPEQWRTGIPHYAGVRYRDVYPGIDMIYYGAGRGLEYDFVVKPGADASRIMLSFDGGGRPFVDHGDLVLRVANGVELRHRVPRTYQDIGGQRTEVENRYRILKAGQVTFALGGYDRSRPLVIDPYVLSLYTYFGPGSILPNVSSLKMFGNSSVFALCNSVAADFPGQPLRPGIRKTIAVTKLTTGGATIFSTYFGATDPSNTVTSPRSLAIDSTGSAIVNGATDAADFPMQNALFQKRAFRDSFVLKLTPAGSGLVFSTYLGGDGAEDPGTVAVDGLGNIAVVGSTSSSNFPVANAFQGVKPGSQSGFVTKFSPDGQQILFSTYLGGQLIDRATAVAFDNNFRVYVAGRTSSGNFPTLSAFQPAYGGGTSDVFVSKFSASGGLIYSTFLGGSVSEVAQRIAVDSAGAAYVSGLTQSTNFPLLNPYQSTNPGGGTFLTKLSATGNSLVYSTYLGGSGAEEAADLSLSGGSVWLTGSTVSTDFPFNRTLFTGLASFRGFLVQMNASTGTLLLSAATPKPSAVTAGLCANGMLLEDCVFAGAAGILQPVPARTPVQAPSGADTSLNYYFFRLTDQLQRR